MALFVLRKSVGIPCISDLIVLPFATGMSITLTLSTLRAQRPPECEYVIWQRVDQKTCLKAITAANLRPIVIEPIVEGDELRTNLESIQNALK